MGYVRTAQEVAALPKLHAEERDSILGRIQEGGRKIKGTPDWIP